jgi:hypothetical protein
MLTVQAYDLQRFTHCYMESESYSKTRLSPRPTLGTLRHGLYNTSRIRIMDIDNSGPLGVQPASESQLVLQDVNCLDY